MAESMKFISDADEDILLLNADGNPRAPYILEERTYVAAETIAVGDYVSLNVASTFNMNEVAEANSGQVDGRCYAGVALEAGGAGAKIRVLKKGMCEVSSLASAAKGAPLYPTTTNGAVDDTPAGDAVLGIALETAGGAPELIYAWINAPF